MWPILRRLRRLLLYRGHMRDGATAVHGREAELSAGESALAAAIEGRPAFLSFEGEPGIGKTALLRAVEKRARAHRFTVRSGRGEEWEVGRPFSALGRAAAVAAPDPVGLGRLRGPQDLRGAHHRAVDAFVEGVEEHALESPLLLSVDDLQWADAASLACVDAVVRRLDGLPVLVLLASRPLRPGTPAASLVSLVQRSGGQVVRLGPLDGAATEALARDRLGRSAGPRLRRQLDRCAGNPFFVQELLEVLSGDGLLESRGDLVETTAPGNPPSLHAVLLRHLGFLSEGALDLLRWGAVLGPEFTVDEIASVASKSTAEVVPLLEEIIAAGVLSGDDPAGLSFRHDLVREAIYEDVAPAIRPALHRRAVQVLAGQGASSLRVAHHLTRTGDVGADAQGWLVHAADEAAPADPETAIALLRRAAGDGVAPPEVAARMAMLLSVAGDSREAEEWARTYLASGDEHMRHDVEEALVHVLFAQGRWDALAAVADRALSAADGGGAHAARLLAQRAMARVWQSDPAEAERDAHEAVRVAEACGDVVGRTLGLVHLSVVACHRGNFGRGLELARSAVETAAPGAPVADRVHAQMGLGMAFLASGELRRARATLRAGRRVAEDAGSRWDVPLHHAMLAIPSLLLGEWDEAVAEAEASLAAADELGAKHGSVAALSVLALVAGRRGDDAKAREAIARAGELVAAGPQWGHAWLLLAAAERRQRSGDSRGALVRLRQGWDASRAAGIAEGLLMFGPSLAQSASAAGCEELAGEVAGALGRVASETAAPYATAAWRLSRAFAGGGAADAVAAVEHYRRAERLPDAAAAASVAAFALAEEGRADEARALLDDANRIYGELGARSDLDLLEHRAAAAGLRPGRRRAPRPTFGWDALTKAELEVAHLAAKGLTNPAIGERLFISRRTVQSHLSHIFTKLEISSRVQLTAEVLRRLA